MINVWAVSTSWLTRVLRRLGLISAIPFTLVAATPPPASQTIHWKTAQTEAYPKKRDDIYFADRSTGFYGTGAGRLFRTDDGGTTWRLVWEKHGTFIRAIGFIDRDRGFLGNLGRGLAGTTDEVPLYRTGDGGKTWSPVTLPGPIAGVCSIDILRSKAIVEGYVRERIVIHAAGRANGPASVARSEDGGETWSVIDLSLQAGMILDIKFIDPMTGFVFAGSSPDLGRAHALILKTRDGGRTWHEVYRSTRPLEVIWKASFPSDRTAFASLQNNDPKNIQQRIVRTSDGGDHWSELPLVNATDAKEFGIGFVDNRHGWVGTAIGGFETRDGGRHWVRSDLAPMANKIRTQAGDGSAMIYAVGSEVQLRRPDDKR